MLDEPNANLDAEGEAALVKAVAGVRQRGGIAVVIAHRPSALGIVDLVLVMEGGQAKAFGPRDDVLAKVLKTSEKRDPAVRATSSLRVVNNPVVGYSNSTFSSSNPQNGKSGDQNEE